MSFYPRRKVVPGAPPGIDRRTTSARTRAAALTLMDFDLQELVELRDADISVVAPYSKSTRVTWLHVQGEVDLELVRHVGDAYSLHSLALEDVFHTGQRPKLETYDDQIFAIVQTPELDGGAIRLRQLSLFLGTSWVVSFHNGPSDPFGPVRERIRNQTSPRIRKRGSDYLFYALLDIAVDLAFPALDVYADRIEVLESAVFDDPSREALDQIHGLKREMLVLRRSLWPQREVLSLLARDEFELINDETRLFLRDCYDHTIQVMELLESFREMASSLLEVYLSSLSNRMNDVMKVLTIMATVFIPLSFLVGVYGMNFDTEISPWNMPELSLRYGYVGLWLVMLSVVIVMLLFFRRRGWL